MIGASRSSVLVVDDESSNIIALMNILNPEHTVYAAKNGENALAVAQKQQPDVILLDIVMPDMDGYTVISELKKLEATRNIPVIFISGLGKANDEEKGLALGAADYITKPFSPALVKLRVLNQIKLIEKFRANEYEIAQTMEKVEKDAHWYKSILDAIPMPISVTDTDMRWTFVNKASEEFLGAKREDMYGEHCSKWGSGKCGANDCGVSCARRELKRTFFNNNDSSYQIDVESLLDMDGNVSGFIEIVQDITNVKQLAKQQIEAEMTSKAKSAFFGKYEP